MKLTNLTSYALLETNTLEFEDILNTCDLELFTVSKSDNYSSIEISLNGVTFITNDNRFFEIEDMERFEEIIKKFSYDFNVTSDEIQQGWRTVIMSHDYMDVELSINL